MLKYKTSKLTEAIDNYFDNVLNEADPAVNIVGNGDNELDGIKNNLEHFISTAFNDHADDIANVDISYSGKTATIEVSLKDGANVSTLQSFYESKFELQGSESGDFYVTGTGDTGSESKFILYLELGSGDGSSSDNEDSNEEENKDGSYTFDDLYEICLGTDAQVVLEDIEQALHTDELLDLVNSQTFVDNDDIIEFITFDSEVESLRSNGEDSDTNESQSINEDEHSLTRTEQKLKDAIKNEIGKDVDVSKVKLNWTADGKYGVDSFDGSKICELDPSLFTRDEDKELVNLNYFYRDDEDFENPSHEDRPINESSDEERLASEVYEEIVAVMTEKGLDSSNYDEVLDFCENSFRSYAIIGAEDKTGKEYMWWIDEDPEDVFKVTVQELGSQDHVNENEDSDTYAKYNKDYKVGDIVEVRDPFNSSKYNGDYEIVRKLSKEEGEGLYNTNFDGYELRPTDPEYKDSTIKQCTYRMRLKEDDGESYIDYEDFDTVINEVVDEVREELGPDYDYTQDGEFENFTNTFYKDGEIVASISDDEVADLDRDDMKKYFLDKIKGTNENETLIEQVVPASELGFKHQELAKIEDEVALISKLKGEDPGNELYTKLLDCFDKAIGTLKDAIGEEPVGTVVGDDEVSITTPTESKLGGSEEDESVSDLDSSDVGSEMSVEDNTSIEDNNESSKEEEI